MGGGLGTAGLVESKGTIPCPLCLMLTKWWHSYLQGLLIFYHHTNNANISKLWFLLRPHTSLVGCGVR